MVSRSTARRVGAETLVVGGALLAATVSGCSAGEVPPTTPTTSSASPVPTSVRDADPCSFVEQSVLTANGLKQESTDTYAMNRNCWWTTDAFATGVLVRWDRSALTDFSEGYPRLVGTEVEIGDQKAILAKSDVQPACAAVFFAEQATIVEIVVAYKPPATADTACERVKTIGGAVVQRIGDQYLADEQPTSPTTS
jgi:Protein of unknown function (DUF3558)